MLTKKGDLVEQMQYLKQMTPIPCDKIVDIDGMVQNPDQFNAKFGWLPEEGDDIHFKIAWNAILKYISIPPPPAATTAL